MSQDNGAEDARTARQREILKTLQQARQVDATELAHRFGVSSMTIRRDLAELSEAGQLQRVHGGAVIRRAPAYGSRASARAPEKAAIARAAAQLVEPGAAVGIDTGTTCHAVAAELAHRSDLTVVTNALHAAITVREGGNRVIVLGGLLTPELSLVSPGTTQQAPQIHLDLLILGCGGLAVDRGITYFDPTEVEVRRLLAGVADRVVVVADHSKFDHKKAMVLGPLDLIDVLVTDRTPPEPLAAALTTAGVDVVVAS
ncbi:DeoR/GlpR family DNA-binding transcription regulator [Actinoplanes sp. URMC 104]|uniref:DeoR/GlpR family DNA-binding transcription regulator n=1 Tax=Actinoplanes sp. URMC 104 TaxID=3423409 RepID=UPI003F1C3BE1